MPAAGTLSRETMALLVASVALFAAGAVFAMNAVPFPSPYDELQHLSFIQALRDSPTLLPAYGSYRVLNDDLSSWSVGTNYLAHPPLFYLLLAPLAEHVAALRAVNALMAVAGFALCACAGVAALQTGFQRGAFLALLLVFSKPALVAGMINNDNLVLLETGLLMGCIVSFRDRSLAIAALLAAVGWTKFNALVGLTMWVACLHLTDLRAGRAKLFGKPTVSLAVGCAVGAIPAVANLLALGTPTYVATDFLLVDPAARPSHDVASFATAFFTKIGWKVLYMDGLANLLPFLILTAIIGGFALCARAVPTRTRAIAVSAWLAMLAFATLHLFYGWNSFRTLGSMSDAQSRYYGMLWPGFALAVTLGTSTLADVFRQARTMRRALAGMTP